MISPQKLCSKNGILPNHFNFNITRNVIKEFSGNENQRRVLKECALKLQIKNPEDWGKVKVSQVIKNGGSCVLQQYKNSLFRTLTSVFPEIPWKRDWFPAIKEHSKGFWIDKSNQKSFLDNLAIKLNIKYPFEWGTVGTQSIIEHGGGGLLLRYRYSLFRMLKTVYEDIEWKEEWFTSSHLHKYYNNHREFMDSIGKKLNIRKHQEWGTVTKLEFHKFGGNFLKAYNYSLFEALQSIYPEIEWKQDWFLNRRNNSYGYWKDKRNQRNYFNKLAKIFEIKEPKDWGRITVNRVYENGGKSLLIHYNNSLFRALRSVYIDIPWKKEWFANVPIYPRNHWNSEKNQREFLEKIAANYFIVRPKEWTRITSSLIRKHGGQGLLSKYDNSISRVINSIYKFGFGEQKSSIEQGSVNSFVKELFPMIQ